MSGSIRKLPILPMRLKQAYELEQKAAEYLKWAQKQNWDGVATAFVSGAAKGAAVGIESALNGRTLGAYEWLDEKFDLGKDQRRQEIQQLAESADLGDAFQQANTVAEIGGGMKGLAETTWNAGAKMMRYVPVLKNSKIIAPAIGGAGLSSLVENSFKYDFSDLKKIGLGSLEGTAAAVALIALQNGAVDVLKKFFPWADLAGLKKGGIDNVVQDEKAMATVQRGMEVNSDLAKTVAEQAPAAAQRINQNTENVMNQALKQHIDVPQTVANRQEQFNNYIQQHSADEVLDFAPTKQQILKYKPESSFNPTNYELEYAVQKLRERAKVENLSIYNDELTSLGDRLGANHMLKSKDLPNIRTVNNTINKPDISYNQNGNNYYIKKYNVDGQDFLDFVIVKNDKLFNKFKTTANYIQNQIKNPTDNVSINRQILKPTDSGYITTSPNHTGNISMQSIVVNPNLPHISELYKDLLPNQQKMLNEALNRALQQNSAKAGSFGNLQSAVNELDKMIAAQSQSGTNPTEIADMLYIKNYLSQHLGKMYRQEAQKLTKAKQLENVYQAGQQAAPLPQSASQIEQTAYAQGRFENMAANSANQNLAQQVLQEPDINNRVSQEIHLWLQQKNIEYQRNLLLQQQAQQSIHNVQKPRNYIEQIRFYLDTEAGRRALNQNFNGANKWYSHISEPYFMNSTAMEYERQKNR